MKNMASSADPWRQYCGFFEQPFEKQLEQNEAFMKEHLQRWAQTAQAKSLCPNGFASIDDIPITTYSDYPVLLEFKSRIEALEKSWPRMPGELCWDYYDRIGREAAKPLSDYIIGEFSFAAKTSGTVSEPKWAVHGFSLWENFRRDTIATMLLSCSDSWGRTRFRIGDKGFNFTPSAPFLSGWGRKASQGFQIDVPPVDVMDNIADARERFFVALQYLEKGHKIDMLGGMAPTAYLLCEYFSNPESFFEEYFHSVNMGPSKLYLLEKWAEAKISKRSRKLSDFLSLKGLMIGGVDTALYRDYFKMKLGVDPFCIYGATELGLPMFGSPDAKSDLLPNLRSCYLEFRDSNGEIRKISEIEVGNTYHVVATPFGGLFMRYEIGDLVRAVGKRDDGMPVFSFWGRENATITIFRPPHITEAFAAQIMARAGLSLSDKWSVTKTFEGREKLLFLMENTWGLSEAEAEKRIFEAIMVLNPDLRQYAREFNIEKPEDMVEVEYLKTGAFLRYSMKRGKEGVPIGQVKPPKIIPSERQDICDLLRSV